MNKRVLVLGICILFFAIVTTLSVYRAISFRKNNYRVGAIPAEITNQLLPETVPLSALRPPALRTSDPMRFGGVTSSLSVIEFGDFECETCRAMTPVIEKVVQSYGGRVRFVWRDMPVEQTHKNALSAAVFARCAGLQGKYWEAHDELIRAPSLSDRLYRDIASRLTLDQTELAACRRTPEIETMIRKDVEEARADGIPGVPLIFVGTQAFQGLMTEEELREAIDRALGSV